MAFRRTIAFLATATVLLIWGAAPAWAAPSVTVAPATDLVDRQVVEVTAFGFPPDTFVAAIMCEPDPATLSDCDVDPIAPGNADGGGRFSTTLPVRRFIETNAGVTDCATAPGACVLVVGTPDLSQVAAAPLTFDPDAPALPPFRLTATVDGRATVDRTTGWAFVTITLSCNRGGTAFVGAQLVQTSTRRVTTGTTFIQVPCPEDPGPVVLSFEPERGAFSGGDAHLRASAEAFTADERGAVDISTVVHVVRSK